MYEGNPVDLRMEKILSADGIFDDSTRQCRVCKYDPEEDYIYLELKEDKLETISLEYHEVLSAAFGHQVEENKHNALEKYKGQYVLVVDGSIPLKDNGIYCMVAGEPIVDHIRKAAEGAAASFLSCGTPGTPRSAPAGGGSDR